jgi:hypothetical protein
MHFVESPVTLWTLPSAPRLVSTDFTSNGTASASRPYVEQGCWRILYQRLGLTEPRRDINVSQVWPGFWQRPVVSNDGEEAEAALSTFSAELLRKARRQSMRLAAEWVRPFPRGPSHSLPGLRVIPVDGTMVSIVSTVAWPSRATLLRSVPSRPRRASASRASPARRHPSGRHPRR